MKPLRVYLVDDSAFFVRAACAFLDGYETMEIVGTAGTGRQALAQAPSLQPDVILLDFGLPDLAGLELVPALQALLPRAVIVMWTLYDRKSYREAARKAGADGFVPKGRLAQDLMGTIEGAIQARERRRESADVSATKPGDGYKEGEDQWKG